jgi:hypothetical protein
MGGVRSFLFVAWVFVLLITIGLWTYVPTLTGAHSDPHPFHFLPYPPGIAIAVVAGSTGGMLNGLFAVWNEISSGRVSPTPADPALYYLPPILGAFAGIVMFFILAAGGLSLIDPKGAFSVDLQNSASTGFLIYKLTPTSPPQLAVFVIYTTVAGYFFTRVPETLGFLKDHVGSRTHQRRRPTH